jgi:nitrite reductase/ring-hydroxylating ferredoxin subunit/uncharacterized membrane protein
VASNGISGGGCGYGETMVPSEQLEQVSDRIERAEVLDPVIKILRRAGGGLAKPSRAKDLLAGKPLGHPMHPASVLVTGGALLSATVLDLVGGSASRVAARRLITVGLATAPVTALAGWTDWLDTEQAESRTGLVHATVNTVGLAAYLQSWRAKGRGRRGLIASAVGATALSAGGWLGGHLAYAQGVGVDTNAFQTGPTDWNDIGPADAVTERLQRFDVDGVPLLLTRVDGDVVALADRCGHRGAPLTDGSRAGNTVICPWHQSCFSLRTGQVIRGPATRPQPRYDVREHNGRLQVRREEPRSLRLNPVGV